MADVTLASTSSALSGATLLKSSGSPATGALAKFSAANSLTSGDLSGDVTTSGSLVVTIANNAVTTAKINNAAVTLAKIQNASANSKLLGSGASGSGSAYTEITLGTGLSMSGTTLNASAGTSTTSPTILGTYTASAAATLDITTRTATGTSGAIFQSDFAYYQIILEDIVPATDNVQLYVRFSEDGGATYRATAGDYFYHTFWSANTPTSGVFNDGSFVSTAFAIAVAVDTTAATSGLIGVNGELKVTKPTTAQNHKVSWDTQFYANTPRFEQDRGSGWFTRSNAVNAIRFLFSAGNITSGTVTIVGYP